MNAIKTEKIEITEMSSKVILTDLCRICLNNNSTDEHYGSNIFEKHLGDVELTNTDSNLDEDDHNTLLCQALEQLTTATFPRHDGFPELICSDCEVRVVEAFILKRVTEKSNDSLLEMVGDMIAAHTGRVSPDSDDKNIVIVHANNEGDVFNITMPSSLPPPPPRKTTKPMIGSIIRSPAVLGPIKAKTGERIIGNGGDDEEDAVSFLLNSQAVAAPLQLSARPRGPMKVQLDGTRRTPHECTVCDKRFSRRSNLVDHLRLHADLKPFTCAVCNKSFVQKGNLISHMRTHTLEKPYSCTQCDKSYNQSSALTVHMRSHTNERNYPCSVCSKAFTNASDRRKHERIHDESSQIPCEFCHKTFAQNINYRKHVERFHVNPSEINGNNK